MRAERTRLDVPRVSPGAGPQGLGQEPWAAVSILGEGGPDAAGGLGGGEERETVRTLVMAGHFEETFFFILTTTSRAAIIIPICG